MRFASLPFSLAFASCVSAEPVRSESDRTQPYQEAFGEIIEVIDGDTIRAKIDLWPGLTGEYVIRERGIDAPEIRRVSCEEERELGNEAKEALSRIYRVGDRIRLETVEYGAFAGRFIADISRWRSDRWLYLEDEMIERGLAVAWYPDQDDVPWCLLAKEK
jgi:endonuclease YncB( thermonuclease family)